MRPSTDASPPSAATHVDLLRASDVTAVGALLANAMEIDPAYRYLFPVPTTRTSAPGDFFTRNLRTHLPHACSHVMSGPSTTGAHEPCATVTLRPPAGVRISTLTMLRHGLIP